MKNHYLSTEGLISNFKLVDPRLFEILKNLNEDLKTGRLAPNVLYEPGPSSPQVLQNAGSLTIAEVIELIVSMIPVVPPIPDAPSQAEFDALVAAFGNHHLTHTSGQSDAFVATDLLEALVKRVRTTTADLVFGTIADGELLLRSGLTIIGTSFMALGRWEPITNGNPAAPEILFDAVTGDVLMNFVP